MELITCVNLTQHKSYVYQLNGILVKRWNFHDKVKKYGEITSYSPNGNHFILRHTESSLSKNSNFAMTASKQFTVFTLDIFGFHKDVEVDLEKESVFTPKAAHHYKHEYDFFLINDNRDVAIICSTSSTVHFYLWNDGDYKEPVRIQ